MAKYKILVPNDFTPIAENAIEHAISLAKTLGGEIHLLNIVADGKKVPETKTKLDAEAKSITSKSGIQAHGIAREGNIFDDIADVASEIGAGIIVMGTHGMKGMQKLTGSKALKVIISSKVPFIVVQKKGPNPNGVKSIVLPIGAEQETKQKLNIAANMADEFGAKIHCFYPQATDEFVLKNIRNEVAFAKKFLLDKKVSFEIKGAEKKGSFVKQLIDYAVDVKGDLIAIVNSQDNAMIPGVAGGSGEQEIITNTAEIPVVIMNPSDLGNYGGVLGT